MRPSLAWFVGLGLLSAACGSPSASPAPTSAPSTAAKPAAPATSAAASGPSPAAVVSPVPSPAAAAPAASPGASPAAAASPSPAASGAGTRFILASESSEARFRVKEQFVGIDAPNDAVGTTKEISGSILIGPNGAVVPAESKLVLNLNSLRTDQSNRDNFIKRNTLETQQFPNAELVVKELQGLPNPVPTAGQATFKLLGDFTVHGVTRPTTWDVTAQFSGQEAKGIARTAVTITEFGMEMPRAGRIASVEDNVRLEIDFTASRS
jgi:polyisoprenoid-binding protein YceI